MGAAGDRRHLITWRCASSGASPCRRSSPTHDVDHHPGLLRLLPVGFSLPGAGGGAGGAGLLGERSVVVFDRVRETFKKKRNMTTPQVLDHAITSTISRTIIPRHPDDGTVDVRLFGGGKTSVLLSLALTSASASASIHQCCWCRALLVMWLGVSREQFIKPKAVVWGCCASRWKRKLRGAFSCQESGARQRLSVPARPQLEKTPACDTPNARLRFGTRGGGRQLQSAGWRGVAGNKATHARERTTSLRRRN